MNCTAIVETGATTVVNLDFPTATGTVQGQIHLGDLAVEGMQVQYSSMSEDATETRVVDVMAEGNYIINNAPAGELRLSAQLVLTDSSHIKRIVECYLPEGETIQQDFDFSVSGTLSGHLQGQYEGFSGGVYVLHEDAPIPANIGSNFFVEMQAVPFDYIVSMFSCDENGNYQSESIAPGSYHILAIMVKKGSRDPADLRFAKVFAEIKAGEATSLDFDFR